MPGGRCGGRTGGARKRLVKRSGGSKESEAAVQRGLKWLAEHQGDDGRWSLHDFAKTKKCNGKCANPGTISDTAGTALALLPFFGVGETHRQGKYQQVVRKGLDWLLEDQQPDGSFRNMHGGTMYAHGQATIALCEALAVTRDKKLESPAQRAIDYIVEAQHDTGGWRYVPRSPGDTSVLGWQILALRSAQAAELKIPKQTFSRTTRYLDSAQADDVGGRYAYIAR